MDRGLGAPPTMFVTQSLDAFTLAFLSKGHKNVLLKYAALQK